MQNLQDKLWQASMAITAFAVLQGLGFLFSAPGAELQKALDRGQWYVTALIIFYHLLFCAGIHWCHKEIKTLSDNDQSNRVSKFVEAGQIFMVLSFGVFSALTVIVIDVK